MDSLRMFVEDATGRPYCFTITANDPREAQQFRKHAAWWKRYVSTAEGRKAYLKRADGGPAFPLRTVIEPFDSKATAS